ncbi:MAG: sulfotransferase [Actinomycetota bacterium]
MTLRRRLRRSAGRLTAPRDPRAPALAAPSVGDADRADAIFLVGCQRSGTSLLRRIVDSHPKIACPPETAFVGPLVHLLHDPRARKGFDGMGYGPEAVTQALARFIASFYESYADAQQKPRWADKTPHHVDLLEDLWTLFGPGARFVTIVRDGRDVAYSLSERFYPAIQASVREAGGDVPLGAARFWVAQTEKILAFEAAHPEACHRIRYEDLTADPAATLEPLFVFLGEAWDPSVTAYADVPHHAGLEDPGVARRSSIEPNSGRHRAWAQDVQDAVGEVCAPLLARLGYA